MKVCPLAAVLLAAALLLSGCGQRGGPADPASSAPEAAAVSEPAASSSEAASTPAPASEGSSASAAPESASQAESAPAEPAGQPDDMEARIAATACLVTDAFVGTHTFDETGLVPWTDDRQRVNFLLALAFGVAGSGEETLYSPFFYYDGERLLHISATGADRVPIRTLGLPEDWTFAPQGIAVDYDPAAEEFVTAGGFGLGSGWQVEERSATVQDSGGPSTTVTVDFTARPGLPNAIDHVSGQITYSLQPGDNIPYLAMEEFVLTEMPAGFDLVVPGLDSTTSLRWLDAATGYEYTTQDQGVIQQVYQLLRGLIIYRDTPATGYPEADQLQNGCFTLLEFYGPGMETPHLVVKLQPFSVEWPGRGEAVGPWATENEAAVAAQLVELWKADSSLWQ